MACLGRLGDTVDDSLIVEDLAGGNGSGAAVLYSVAEGADLLVEEAALGLDDRDHGLGLLAANLVIELHCAANGAVPALGGGDAQTALGTQNDGVTGGVHIHGPRDTEVQHDAALKAYEGYFQIYFGNLLFGSGLGHHVVSHASCSDRDRCVAVYLAIFARYLCAAALCFSLAEGVPQE